jgi:hypothetical protein
LRIDGNLKTGAKDCGGLWRRSPSWFVPSLAAGSIVTAFLTEAKMACMVLTIITITVTAEGRRQLCGGGVGVRVSRGGGSKGTRERSFGDKGEGEDVYLPASFCRLRGG